MPMTQDEAEFAKWFDQGEEPSEAVDNDTPTPTPEDAPTADGEGSGEPAAVALVIADGEEMERAQDQATADATVSSPEAQGGAEDEGPLDPKEQQRLRSWEGRMRAREEAVRKREEALAQREAGMPAAAEGATEGGEANKSFAEAIEQGAESMEQDGDGRSAEKVEQIADAVESGTMTIEQAKAQLGADFGPDFVSLIETLASSIATQVAQKMAGGQIDALRQEQEALINAIADERERAHFKAISKAHGDFMEVASSPEFEEFKKSYPDGERIAESGDADEIIEMISKFKSDRGGEPAVSEEDIDAAAGVRTGGIRLPEAPRRAEGYEDAWEQF